MKDTTSSQILSELKKFNSWNDAYGFTFAKPTDRRDQNTKKESPFPLLEFSIDMRRGDRKRVSKEGRETDTPVKLVRVCRTLKGPPRK